MFGFQTPVVVIGGTAVAYLILMLLTLRRRGFGSWLHGLLFLYLLMGIVWTIGKALAAAKGVVPAVPVYGAMIATDALAILPVLLTILTLLFFERPGAQRVGQIGIGWVAFIALADGNVLGLRELLQNSLHLDTPEQTLKVLVLTGWVGFTGGALVLAIWDYIRIQRPLHRNRILYWVAATLLIGMGEGLTMLPSVEMSQVGAFTRLMGVLLMAYVTLDVFFARRPQRRPASYLGQPDYVDDGRPLPGQFRFAPIGSPIPPRQLCTGRRGGYGHSGVPRLPTPPPRSDQPGGSLAQGRRLRPRPRTA